ncbi:MAG: DUF4388 domain-containing protein [Thermoanaerobaculia bacterium]|nr:DUF4388 domain-containing protein [Thermoanaerobaculia bacterium]
MSLNGKLEDVSLADVMQFVHLGRRTGTLSLQRGHQEAEIGFHRGQIVSARGPGTLRLSELLVEKGFVHSDTMEQILRQQISEQPRRSLGQVLTTSGTLDFENIRAAIEEQIEETIYELVGWSTGSFEFALDELKPNEDIAMYPGDVIPKLDLNTQMVLLEASRMMDENRQAEAEGRPVVRRRDRPEISGPEPSEMVEVGDEQTPQETILGEERSLDSVAEVIEGLDIDLALDIDEDDLLPEAAHRRLQVVSPDRSLADDLDQIIQPEIAQVVRVPLREAGTRLPGEPTPTIVVLDMREGHHSVDDLLAIRRSRPRSSLIALVDTPELTTQAFESGAVAALSADPVAIAACFHSLIRTLQDAGPITGPSSGSKQQKQGFARLRRVLADIRSGLLSATMALNLMHIISESVERAVLLLVRGDTLTALGAFGFSADGRPLAEVTRSLAVPISNENVIARCIADGQPRSVGYDQARLPPEFSELLGRPRNGQVVVFPVMGSERVISVVYTDNGSSNRAIEDIELLELATAQVGVAFENELLRRQMQGQ